MDFGQYLFKWLSMSFAYPWNILQAVLSAVAILGGIITATKPSWAERMKKHIALAWKVALIAFAIVFVVNFINSSYNIYQDLNSDIARVSNELDVLVSKVLILQKATSTPYSEQMPIQINNSCISFPNTNVTVNNRIFIGCSLFMNQHYLYFKNCQIVNGNAEGMTEFTVIPINAMPEGGIIQFTGCVLENCWFVDANIIGNETEIAYFESNISGGSR